MRLNVDRDSLKMVLVLTVIAIVSALLLSGLNILTYVSEEDIFARKVAKAYDGTISQSLDCSDFDNVANTEITNAVIFEDGTAGIVVHSKKAYSGSGLSLLVFINDGRIDKVTSYQNSETPGIGSNALNEEGYLYKYQGLSVAEFARDAVYQGVDAWSGATKSSNGVKLAVNAAAVFYKEVVQNG